MYPKKVLPVLLTILGCLDIWCVQSLRHRSTTKSPWIDSNTTEPVKEELKDDNRYHHQPQSPPQQLPHYPPQIPTQSPLQYPSQIPSQKPPQYIPQHPPQSPQPILPQYPPYYQPQNPQPAPPTYIPQNPPPSPPQYLPQNPPQYPPQYPPQTTPSNLPHYPPLSPQPVPPVSILDQFDNRYPDGSYEFRYELPDETVRYERGYFVHYQHKNILVVKGYYSYRLPDHRYLTVFYTADQYGYRQDSSTFSSHRPQLPRSLNVKTVFTEELSSSPGMQNSTNTTS